MKKATLFLLLLSVYSAELQAQQRRVGINVTSPDENLHVDSTIKIGRSQALGTGTPGRKNLLKFGDADYVTIGEEQADDRLYIRYGDLIFFRAASAAGTGRIGVKTETPTADFHVNGTFRLEGNGAAAGSVLTSDASGNATWQSPSSGGVGFRGVINTDFPVTQAAGEVQLNGFTTEFSDGGGFNASAGTFTAPSAGVYQFVVNLNWTQSTNTTGTSIIIARLYQNGSYILDQTNNIYTNNTSYSQLQNITTICKLSAGDVITVRVDPQVSYTYTIVGGGSTAGRFAGVKLY